MLSLGTQTYAKSSPVTTDDVTCFGVSWLSINASAADFPYTFSEAAVLSESRSSRRDRRIQDYENGGRGRMHETN